VTDKNTQTNKLHIFIMTKKSIGTPYMYSIPQMYKGITSSCFLVFGWTCRDQS